MKIQTNTQANTQANTQTTPTSCAASYAARLQARSEALVGHTGGLAPGCVQGNLVILPQALASDFLLFCYRNPKPCPVLGVSNPGAVDIPALGQDIDIRTDVPRYRIWTNGVLESEVNNIQKYWRKDLVTFVLGCSFSFEQALLEAGIPLRHIACGKNVAMYHTNIQTEPAGSFRGTMVVSMRPMKAAHAIRAIQVCSRFPSVHGAPVHLGDPAQIGISNLSQPDFGDPVEIKSDEIPVFWACGVTPQSIVMEAKPDFCITHAPGCMLVTDLQNNQLASF